MKRSLSIFSDKKEASGKKVAVVGSGPAGLSAAYHLVKDGHACEVFEKENRLGGSLHESIEKGDLPENILTKEIEILKQFGVVFSHRSKN